METYRIITDKLNRCCLVFARPVFLGSTKIAQGEIWEIWCPRDGGYVRRITKQGKEHLGVPVCVGLAEHGIPLIHNPTLENPLCNLIQHHAKKLDLYERSLTLQ